MNNKNDDGQSNTKKFLFVSFEALAVDLARKIKKEGNDVKFYIEDPTQKDIGDGMFEKVDDWKAYKDWADVIIFDDIGFGKEADALRKEGKAVVGGSVYTDNLEDKREIGQKEMAEVKMDVLPSWDFTNFDAAIDFVVKNSDRYVLKPSGAAQNEKELLYVGKEDDGADMIHMLGLYKKNWSKKIKMFQLQKFASGVEVAIGAFFNGKDFIYPININFEHKKMFPGEVGPSTGEMGTSMYWSKPNKLFEATLEKMKEKLVQSGYVGYIDVNCIANKKGVFPLEFTSRFGYPTINIQMDGIQSPMGEFMDAISHGVNYSLKTKNGFQVGVVIAVPPFPFNDPAAFKRYSEDAMVIFKKPNFDGIHSCDIKIVDDEWRLAGNSGYALVVTGNAETMSDARDIVYKRIENIMIPNMFYRTDIGERWKSDGDRLQTWGYT